MPLSAFSILLVAACGSPPTDLMDDPPNATSAELSIALQDGFEEDLVVVRVNGDEVLRRPAVTTDIRIGLAYSFDVRAERLPADLVVEVPTRGVSGRTTVEASGPLYVGASVVGGAVQFRVSQNPFGYL